MPFKDSIDGVGKKLALSWDIQNEGILGDLLKFGFNDVKWAFPMKMITMFFLHEYEILERRIIYKMYDENDRVLEAGAGSGVTGLSILRTGAWLVAYEPQEAFANLAVAVYAVNGYDDVEVRVGAIASKSGSVLLAIDKIAWDATILDTKASTKEVEVPCLNVNEAIARDNINALHLDVEGAEVNILEALDFTPLNKFTAEIHPSMIGFDTYDDIIKPKLLDAGFYEAHEEGKKRNYPTHNYCVGWKRKET